MKRILALAVLAATALVASLATPMMAADTSSTPSGTTATTISAPSAPSSEAGSTAAAPAPSKVNTAYQGPHRKKKHRMLHHARNLDKGTTSTAEGAASGTSK
jgi:hypothetical protein